MPIIAAVQINGSSNIEKNLSSTERLVRAAAKAGAADELYKVVSVQRRQVLRLLD